MAVTLVGVLLAAEGRWAAGTAFDQLNSSMSSRTSELILSILTRPRSSRRWGTARPRRIYPNGQSSSWLSSGNGSGPCHVRDTHRAQAPPPQLRPGYARIVGILVEPIVGQWRNDEGDPTIYENFEWVATTMDRLDAEVRIPEGD